MSENMHQQKISEYVVELLLVGLSLVQAMALVWMVSMEQDQRHLPTLETEVTEGQRIERVEPRAQAVIPKLSALRGPQIDAEGVMAVVDQAGRTVPIQLCETLPVSVWVFLIAAYVLLLGYNLVSGFRPERPVQWFWEGVLTAAALLAWLWWEECRGYVWYPLAIVQFGITLYVLYLLSYRRRERAIDYEHVEEPVW